MKGIYRHTFRDIGCYGDKNQEGINFLLSVAFLFMLNLLFEFILIGIFKMYVGTWTMLKLLMNIFDFIFLMDDTF